MNYEISGSDHKPFIAMRRLRVSQSRIRRGALAIIFVFFLSCEGNIISRSTAEYYPAGVGASWRYRSDTSEMFIKVDAETTWANLKATLFLVDGEAQYRSRLADGVYYYYDLRIPYGGNEYPIESRYLKWLDLPLVSGNTWQDVFRDSIVVAGEPVRIEHRISGRIKGFDNLNVPAGNFEDVYEVEIVNVVRIFSSIYTRFDSTLRTEYYAPYVGMISVETPGYTFTLQEYQGL